MNLSKIHASLGPRAPETPYLEEVVRRLDRAAGPVRGVAATVALIDLLALRSVVFRDGFVVNDDRALQTTLGYELASVVGAALCDDPDRPAEWWKQTRLSFHGDPAEREAAWEQQVRALEAHPEVLRVE